MKKIKLNVFDYWSGELVEGLKGKLIGYDNYGGGYGWDGMGLLYVLRLESGREVVVKCNEVE
jgi:hypothetical protein